VEIWQRRQLELVYMGDDCYNSSSPRECPSNWVHAGPIARILALALVLDSNSTAVLRFLVDIRSLIPIGRSERYKPEDSALGQRGPQAPQNSGLVVDPD